MTERLKNKSLRPDGKDWTRREVEAAKKAAAGVVNAFNQIAPKGGKPPPAEVMGSLLTVCMSCKKQLNDPTIPFDSEALDRMVEALSRAIGRGTPVIQQDPVQFRRFKRFCDTVVTKFLDPAQGEEVKVKLNKAEGLLELQEAIKRQRG